MRIFMPDSKASTFRWVFHEVMPSLLGTSIISGIKMIITDGDSQEINVLAKDIKAFMPKDTKLAVDGMSLPRGG